VSELVTVGRVVKPHGIRGEVSVDVLSDVAGRFDPGAVLHGRGRHWTVATARPHQGRLLVRFEEVADRNDAELLRGLVLEAPAADVSESETYFAHELVGMRVLGEAGEDLGEVADLVELPDTAGYDLLEVRRGDGATWLLPAVDDYVAVVEHDGREALQLVDPPAGLVDLGDAVPAGEPPTGEETP
jgi:16S rRNA processing protein RimM